MPVSKDTLRRVVRLHSYPPADPLRVIGIDDWACQLRLRIIGPSVAVAKFAEQPVEQGWLELHPATRRTRPQILNILRGRG